ncbi:unnamed protein product [Durusdinium trenchii]|uniref:C2 domain-containing protein n=2 Tax=Durusdinium trenchii TaxID=1381693 RepID=A0ABP0RJW5_9DINO
MGITSSFCCTDRSGTRRKSQPLSSCYVDFHKPAEATQQGGAQARLFRLLPVVGNNSKGRRPLGSGGPEWLGKDVTSSFNEVDFYNEILHMRRLLQQDPPLQPVLPKLGQQVKEEDLSQTGPWGIVDFMVSYHGLARSCTCSWVADGRERQRVADLLVFRSPFEGLARPRMLHLELGPRSLALQARHENQISTGILARQEGIFVDGFLSPPESISSEGPTLDLRGWSWGDNTQRRAKRLPLQRMQLSQALSSLLDLRAAIAEERFWPSEDSFVPARPGARGADAFLHNFLCAAEYSELALLAFVCELSRLLRACEEVPVPQKWVQSSLALLVEAGVAPPRRGPIQPETWVTSRVKIQILGWSKSSLSLPGSTTQDERQDNELPWQIYQHHVGRVLWESARLYFHSFCAEEWVKFTVQLCEVSKGGSSLLGTAELSSFGACESRTLKLHKGDTPLTNSMGRPTQVVVTLKFLPLPEPSNFTGLWQAQVERAEHVEVGADSLCVMLTATSRQHSMSHRTREVPNAAEVSWNEEFEFPIIPVDRLLSPRRPEGGKGSCFRSATFGGLGTADKEHHTRGSDRKHGFEGRLGEAFAAVGLRRGQEGRSTSCQRWTSGFHRRVAFRLV